MRLNIVTWTVEIAHGWDGAYEVDSNKPCTGYHARGRSRYPISVVLFRNCGTRVELSVSPRLLFLGFISQSGQDTDIPVSVCCTVSI